MPLIQIELDPETDALFEALSKRERRSKREQVAYSALAHAREMLPNFKYSKTAAPRSSPVRTPKAKR